MIKKILVPVKTILVKLFFRHIRRSYSQSGEDIIISDLFTRLGIIHATYLDIGANEPVSLSNTYRLYTMGSSGVCVEPNPILFKKLQTKRKRDTCLNTGVAFDERKEADYYMFSDNLHGLNTFSKEEAAFWENTGNEQIGKHKIEKTIRMKLVDINELMQKYFNPYPNLVSIDVEGLDLEILKTINFDRFKPEVFCIETLQFQGNNKESKNRQLIGFLEEKGYFVYADTYINSILCLKSVYTALR